MVFYILMPWCQAGVVPQLGTPLLIERDCPNFQQLLQRWEGKREIHNLARLENVRAVKAKMHLPVELGEMAHLLTQITPSLVHARQAADKPKDPACQGPYFEWGHSLLYRVVGDQRQLVVPMALHSQLLFPAHEVPCAGHQAVDKMLARLTQWFYWPGIHAEVTRHCAECPECQLVQTKGPKGGLLHHIPIVSVPFE